MFPKDHNIAPRAELAKAEAHLAKVDKQLDRVTEALISSDNPPTSFVRKARELEDERLKATKAIATAMEAVKNTTAINLAGKDMEWSALVEGVSALDLAARTKARQMIEDTFMKITVFHSGADPEETPDGNIDFVLHPKGGVARMFTVDKKGKWIAQEEPFAEFDLAA
jgi:hypothetical protein